jgi:hypothetical protein
MLLLAQRKTRKMFQGYEQEPPSPMPAKTLAWYSRQYEALKHEIARKDAALQFVCEELYAPEGDCSCHISPPCNDCVDHSATRRMLKEVRAALAPVQEKTND